ncbi:unnamed protein product [Linum trigynum]|uniref:Aminotransferase-like plant mobile domain-containing protein n=1 Tax=Linum trigynum TaxID=586398 RepID=A0AAV2CMV6_9ROSI
MLRHFMRLDIDNDLLTAMAERWRPEVHTFHFPEGEMKITLRDVALLTGLPVTGEAIIGNSSKHEGGWRPLILERLGYNMPAPGVPPNTSVIKKTYVLFHKEIPHSSLVKCSEE